MLVNVNGIEIPVHFNDQGYESPECADCGYTLMAKTLKELEAKMEEHFCQPE